jgi:hypothetical protein
VCRHSRFYSLLHHECLFPRQHLTSLTHGEGVQVSKLELWLHVLSFAVSNGALVTGVFGMNLLSNLEMHPTLFYCVVAAIFCSIVAITALIFLYISSRLRTHARTSAQVRPPSLLASTDVESCETSRVLQLRKE